MQKALFVDDPEITLIFDRATGEERTFHHYSELSYDEAMTLRHALREQGEDSSRWLVCALCGIRVSLCVSRLSTENLPRFYFRHVEDPDNCPQRELNRLSIEEMDARKYLGQRESATHIRLKEWLVKSLQADPSFSTIRTEERVVAADGSWRKPDVQATWRDGQRIVFEVQLSTTYLHVVQERSAFYKKEGIALVWIFRKIENLRPAMTQEDIFYLNNRNVFTITEETISASLASGRMQLECHWSPEAGGIRERTWRSQLVSFEQLQLDIPNRRVFFVDCSSTDWIEDFRKKFIAWWPTNEIARPDATWNTLCTELRRHGVTPPDLTTALFYTISAIYSAYKGKPVYWGYDSLIQVAHLLHDSHAFALEPFMAAITAYGRREKLKTEDRKGTLKKRLSKIRERRNLGEACFARDPAMEPLLKLLFPRAHAVLTQDNVLEVEF